MLSLRAFLFTGLLLLLYLSFGDFGLRKRLTELSLSSMAIQTVMKVTDTKSECGIRFVHQEHIQGHLSLRAIAIQRPRY